MQILNTLTVLALVVLSFALIVAVPVLYASSLTSELFPAPMFPTQVISVW